MPLQDRIETALLHFGNTKPDSLANKVQYAYCDAYLDIYREKPEEAANKAAVWADYPVDHWRNRFKNILMQVEEIRGGTVETVDEKNLTQTQTELAANSESFDLEASSGNVSPNFQNLTQTLPPPFPNLTQNLPPLLHMFSFFHAIWLKSKSCEMSPI